jgi:hypothetical protein
VVLQFCAGLAVLATVGTVKTHSPILSCAWLDVVHQLPMGHQFCLAPKVTTITNITATTTVDLLCLLAVAVFIVAIAIPPSAVA